MNCCWRRNSSSILPLDPCFYFRYERTNVKSKRSVKTAPVRQCAFTHVGQPGAKDFILPLAVWDSPRTLLLSVPDCLMKGELHYGFRSSRSEEVYPRAQQTGYRRRAEAERLGGCQDVSVDGKEDKHNHILHTPINNIIIHLGGHRLGQRGPMPWSRALRQSRRPGPWSIWKWWHFYSCTVSDSAGCLLLQLS